MAAFFRRGGKKTVAPHLIDELYYSESGEVSDLTDGAIKLSDEAIAEMMSEIYRETWDKTSLTESLVTKETRNIFREAVSKGVPRNTPRRAAFRERLSKSTDVFSVFRVHTQAQHMAELLVDEEGRRRSFAEWAEEVQPYVNHQNRVWLRTEYDTAMRRAESEADWVRFQEDADLYPCLEWVPTTSANPGADHRPFWGTVLPVDDEFWTEHRPGDRWNCKCSLRQTDKTPTRTPSVGGEQYAPSRGLKSKPGSGEIFSDDHLYFPEDCHICPFGGALQGLWADLTGRKNCMKCKRVQACHDRKTKKSERQRIEENKKLYDRLSKDKRYKDVEFNPTTGALKATHIGHNEGKDEGFRLEKNLVNHLYSCGHSIILADEQKKGRDGNVLTSLDMVLDGVRMDIKSITKNKAHYGSAIRKKNIQLVKFNARTDVHENADTLCMYFDEPKMFSPDKITKGYEYMASLTSVEIQIRHIVCIINSAKGLEIKTFDFE